MPCYHPLKGYRALRSNPSGKFSIVFNQSEGYKDLPIELPCGQCIGCRLDRSRQWAIRCLHEAELYPNNSFVTLTYADANIPPGEQLVKADFQKFMKRLRKNTGQAIRYFHCGEYGESTRRPHYHACLFNYDFPDKKYWKSVNNQKYYVSEQLGELWPQGHSMIGAVTFESAAYVARYICKKVTGKNAEHYYQDVNEEGVVTPIQPEYVTMSRRPGIGKGWYEKFKTDVYPDDFVVVRGKKMKPPKFYKHQYELEDPHGALALKLERKEAAHVHSENNTFERLKVREAIQIEKSKRLIRNYEK